MQITLIEVQSLYGLHNYTIEFSVEDCLKIIHAPNGYGKTTVLKLIKALLNGQIDELHCIPFERFSITLDEGAVQIVFSKEKQMMYEVLQEGEMKTYPVEEGKKISSELNERLRSIKQEMPIYFIDANRLWTEKRKAHSEATLVTPTVLEYGKELGERMREALAQSNDKSQLLDESFPQRLMKRLSEESQGDLSPTVIKSELESLENKREQLRNVGLYAGLKTQAFEMPKVLDETMCKVLSLYIEDSKEKLKVFDVLAAKLNLLCTLINKRFSYKEIEVNMKDGFVFKVPTHEVLKADKLSSGEQNELILMFQLLFKCPPRTLILMDEPEISLHIAWQQNFLEDMEAIAKLSQIRMMIATHSPDIINGRWDLTSALEE